MKTVHRSFGQTNCFSSAIDRSQSRLNLNRISKQPPLKFHADRFTSFIIPDRIGRFREIKSEFIELSDLNSPISRPCNTYWLSNFLSRTVIEHRSHRVWHPHGALSFSRSAIGLPASATSFPHRCSGSLLQTSVDSKPLQRFDLQIAILFFIQFHSI